MWFDDIMNEACNNGFMKAIDGAGYWIESNASNPPPAGKLLEIAEGAPDSSVWF
jgi:hypothetical protein